MEYPTTLSAPDEAVPTTPAPTNRTWAILVIHGIGQQQPFQPLNCFVNGLTAVFQEAGKQVDTAHVMFTRDDVLNHCVSIGIRDSSNGSSTARLDVYEFYWAPLTQGKASFLTVVRWLAATGLTPLRRLVFNIPLLLQRAEARAHKGREQRENEIPLSGGAPLALLSERLSPRRVLHWASLAVIGTKTFWCCVEFLREIWRLIYVSIGVVGFAVLATLLVDRGSALFKQLSSELRSLPDLRSLPNIAMIALALVAAISAVALGWSIPEQFRDFRLRKCRPDAYYAGRQAAQRTYRGSRNFLSGFRAAFRSLREAAAARSRLRAEIRARRWFLRLSIPAFGLAAAAVAWLSLKPGIVHDLVIRLVTNEMLVVASVLAVAFTLKRIFVDYLGDIALYTTANENSAFFVTRAAILKEATRRVRYLLRDPQYQSVAIAGHSLGSVIGYDTINQLRTEARLSGGVWAPLDDLSKLVVNLNSQDAFAAEELIKEVKSTMQGASVSMPATPEEDCQAKDLHHIRLAPKQGPILFPNKNQGLRDSTPPHHPGSPRVSPVVRYQYGNSKL